MIVDAETLKELRRGEIAEVVTNVELVEGAEHWARLSPRSDPALRVQVVEVWAHRDGGWVARIQQVGPPAVTRRDTSRVRKLRLSREVRALLFAGQTPRIAGHGKAPVEPGEEVHLSKALSFVVLAVRPRRGGGWSLQYRVSDRRDPHRLLRRTPGISDKTFEEIRGSIDEYGYVAEEPTAEALDRAARDSAYTGSPASALIDAGEAVDEVTQRRITQEAELSKGQMAEVNQVRRERYDLDQRLRRVLQDADRLGMPVSPQVRALERQIAKLEKRVYEGKAA